MTPRGLLITLEGIDGTGKTTQQKLLVKYLQARGYRVRATREPGGTQIGEQIRRLLLAPVRSHRSRRNRPAVIHPLAELALMYAARAQHLAEIVRPALANGEVIVSDRFNDASMAYQGYGRRLGREIVRAFDRIVCGPTQPDLTIVLDLHPRAALARASARLLRQARQNRRNARRSRFEAEGLRFQERVRAGYLAIARRESRRVKVVRAGGSLTAVQNQIRRLVDAFLAKMAAGGRANREN